MGINLPKIVIKFLVKEKTMTHDDFDIATLYKVVADARNKIQAYGNYYTMGGRSEIRVRAQLIDPILRALGWDPANQQKVLLEYDTVTGSASQTSGSSQALSLDTKHKRRFVDYALCLNDEENLSPCAILEAKKMQMPTSSGGAEKVSNFSDEDFSQLFSYTYNINSNELAFKGNLLYKVISNGDSWLIYSGEKRIPINQLNCKFQLSDNSISLDAIVANLSMLSFPALRYMAKKEQCGEPTIIATLSRHMHQESLGYKYMAIKIGKKWEANEGGQATNLWKIVLNYLSGMKEWAKLICDLPIKRRTKLILQKCSSNTSSMNRNKNGGKGENDMYVFKTNKIDIVFEARSGVPKILSDIIVVLERCGVNPEDVLLEIKMDNKQFQKNY